MEHPNTDQGSHQGLIYDAEIFDEFPQGIRVPKFIAKGQKVSQSPDEKKIAQHAIQVDCLHETQAVENVSKGKGDYEKSEQGISNKTRLLHIRSYDFLQCDVIRFQERPSQIVQIEQDEHLSKYLCECEDGEKYKTR